MEAEREREVFQFLHKCWLVLFKVISTALTFILVLDPLLGGKKKINETILLALHSLNIKARYFRKSRARCLKSNGQIAKCST